jgi:hypothetical protein
MCRFIHPLELFLTTFSLLISLRYVSLAIAYFCTQNLGTSLPELGKPKCIAQQAIGFSHLPHKVPSELVMLTWNVRKHQFVQHSRTLLPGPLLIRQFRPVTMRLWHNEIATLGGKGGDTKPHSQFSGYELMAEAFTEEINQLHVGVHVMQVQKIFSTYASTSHDALPLSNVASRSAAVESGKLGCHLTPSQVFSWWYKAVSATLKVSILRSPAGVLIRYTRRRCSIMYDLRPCKTGPPPLTTASHTELGIPQASCLPALLIEQGVAYPKNMLAKIWKCGFLFHTKSGTRSTNRMSHPNCSRTGVASNHSNFTGPGARDRGHVCHFYPCVHGAEQKVPSFSFDGTRHGGSPCSAAAR